ncbi:hypothetical protein QTN23_13060 [Pseudomonas shirazica]|uniref:hypothetical protein n=1 Tax=Pseudomonas shirazica TaxID=1940636 RepID=UPI0025A9EF3F|nr:hypothetical protein [Pseudomonas shirazica]MDM9600457.1 hypothetical protein [Pseudomonas shirazica]MDO2413843.1 hypothetical protein [Pseudomonas shirazica]
MKEFYMINADEGHGVPLFFDIEWTPKLPEFNQVSENPSRDMFGDAYQAKIDLDVFYGDAFFEQYIVSLDFVSLCDLYNCKYFSVPLAIELRKGREASKGYSLFFVQSRCSILDVGKSKFALMDEGLLRPESERQGMPVVYDRIEKFVIRGGVDEGLFYCVEIKQMVCSSEFKRGYLERNLAGLEFTKIDGDFIYAPWG